MSVERFVIIAIILVIPLMYGISMLWYYFISKKRGIYYIEILVALGAFIGIVILIATAYSADVANALAAIFGSLFLLPLIIGAVISALFVKLTIAWIKKEE